jgi:hypothetical protein
MICFDYTQQAFFTARVVWQRTAARWLVFGAARPKSLERQQNRVASIADELEVLRAVAGVVLLNSASHAKRIAFVAEGFTALKIRDRCSRALMRLQPSFSFQ